jgi:uncharacterized phage protein (TIGR02216 family)
MRIAWGRLMRLGMVELRLAPDAFWALTPAELMLMAGSGGTEGGAMSRSAFEELMARYPDDGGRAEEEARHG